MEVDYKTKYEEIVKELKWFEEYHRIMAHHYEIAGNPINKDIHETAWSEFYLLMEKFDIETKD